MKTIERKRNRFYAQREGFADMRDISTMPTLERLGQLACKEFNVTEDQFYNGPKNRENTAARQSVFYVAYRHFKLSLAVIGQFYNNTSYSSVVYAFKSVSGLMSVYPKFKKRIEDFEAKVLNDKE